MASSHARQARQDAKRATSPRNKDNTERHLETVESAEFTLSDISPKMILLASVVLVVFVWSYLPTLGRLIHTWDTEQDYSHGYLVLPLALYALWVRQDTFPRNSLHWSWAGLILFLGGIGLRVAGGVFYVDAFDGWSILLWAAGACWMIGGWQFFKWCLPGVAFLFFMIPLPHQWGQMLRLPLQKVATKLSCIILQCLGQPALAEGTTIRLGEHELMVEEACSGLRIFVAIAVLAIAYIMIVRPSWWEKVALILAIVPIALISNAIRIVVTGFLYQFVSSKAGQSFSHDFAGWMMIAFAAAQFALVMWYLNKLFKEVDPMEMMYRHQQA